MNKPTLLMAYNDEDMIPVYHSNKKANIEDSKEKEIDTSLQKLRLKLNQLRSEQQ